MSRCKNLFGLVLVFVAACTPALVPTPALPTAPVSSISATASPTLPAATPTIAPTFAPTQPPVPTQTTTPIAPEFKGRFVVVKPSAQDELNRIWGYLKQIDWYDQYGYKPIFPNDPSILALVQKAREKKLGNPDYESLARLFVEKLYNARDYEKGYEPVVASLKIVEQALPTFQKYNTKWGFKMFPMYTVQLTLYGTGGSYNSGNGTIILQTNTSGIFSRGNDPSETIIHETVHIGIEDNIVQKFSLDQRVKERIVDKFVNDHFLSLIPDYRMQSIGDPSIDKYLGGENAWDNLPERIKEYKSNK